jgi:hypothetical protein
MTRLTVIAAALAVAFPGLALAQESQEDVTGVLARMLAGESELQGEDLDEALDEASVHPLGSAENPVRAEMPQGQRAYLNRLRCSDGKRPKFSRLGSAGISPYGNIVDLYSVTCKKGEPKESEVYLDMYHAGYVESRPIPGFTIKD